MFAKLSLMSFICKLAETFDFPNETINKICHKYLMEKVGIYHVDSVDTDSACLKFIFVSNPKSNRCENKFRDIITEVIIASKILISSILDKNIGKNLTRERKALENV